VTSPIPRSGAHPVARGDSTIAFRGPGQLDYRPADGIGLERLPENIAGELRSTGLISPPILVEWVDDTVTKRRTDGSHYQQMEGWWANSAQLNVVCAQRELEPAGGGRFRPSGEWTLKGTSYQLPNGLVPEHSVWRFQPPAGGSGALAAPTTDEPLDLLPSQLTRPVAGGESHASKQWGERWAKEEIIAYRLLDGRVRILLATRESTSRRKLATTDWTAETLDAPVAATAPFTAGVAPGLGTGANRGLNAAG